MNPFIIRKVAFLGFVKVNIQISINNRNLSWRVNLVKDLPSWRIIRRR